MTRHFGFESTTEDVVDGVGLGGKRILVTGVSAGLGIETARALAAHGAVVVGTARDLAKAAQATAHVAADATEGGCLKLIELDLANLTPVHPTFLPKLEKTNVAADWTLANPCGSMRTQIRS